MVINAASRNIGATVFIFVNIHEIQILKLYKMPGTSEKSYLMYQVFLHSNPCCLYECILFANCTKNLQFGIFDVFILHILCLCVKIRTIMKYCAFWYFSLNNTCCIILEFQRYRGDVYGE